MKGYFDSGGRPRLTVTVRGRRQTAELDALIDTGFNGDLTLPIGLAVELGLELVSRRQVELADGSIRSELVFVGTAVLDGRSQLAMIGLTDGLDALVGTGLLRDRRLTMDFRKGTISIT